MDQRHRRVDDLKRKLISTRQDLVLPIVFKAQASAVQEVMKSFGLVAGGVAKAFEGLAGKYSSLAAGAIGVSFATYRIQNDLKGMTAAINNTRLAAERLGTTYASLMQHF